MAHIEGITVYPVKALDGVRPEEVRVLPGGTLASDREFALFDEDGEVFNGKRSARVHRIDASYDPASGVLSVGTPDGERREFDLETDSERERAGAWFSEYFEESLTLERDRELGFVDRREMGPSVISTATLREVASWFDGMTVEGARRRLRANVEVGGVPAFWEDRFVGPDAPSFVAGGIRFEGVTPCGRCVVPSRDPDTGEPLPEFRERFLDRREATFPEWADRSAFDHLFALMIITRVRESDRGETLRVGDSVEVVEG